MNPSSSTSYAAAPSESRSIEDIIKIIEEKGWSFDTLPNVREDPLWMTMKDDCKLSLPELSRLKNHHFPLSTGGTKRRRDAEDEYTQPGLLNRIVQFFWTSTSAAIYRYYGGTAAADGAATTAAATAGVASFAPVVHVLKLGVPFPQALLDKPTAANGSIHASSIISTGDKQVKESLMLWFEQALAHADHFYLEKPDLDERQALPVPEFMSFKAEIERLGYTVWDIQNMTGETVDILLEDSNQIQRRLSGRADFLISLPIAQIRQAASQYAVCVVEKQSKPSDEDCEYQLLAYMVILMNRFGLVKLAGILLYTNGTCRAYRALRDSNSQGMYQENDTFMMYQLPDILQTLLNF